MISYKAPLKDIDFLVNEVYDFQKHYKSIPSGEEATPEMVEAILAEAARFSEEVLAPLYQKGDEGCGGKTVKSPRLKALKKPIVSTLKAAGRVCLSHKNTVAKVCLCLWA